MTGWREYQESVACLFRSLGCTVQVDAEVQGIRTKHRIDVWAVSVRFGLFTRWVVECKAWKSRVPKEKVLALRTIVDDVGADRGFLMAESGFQSGAQQAATSSSITLISLAELETLTAHDRERQDLGRLGIELTRLQKRLQNLTVSVRDDDKSGWVIWRPRLGAEQSWRDDQYMAKLGELSVLERACRRAEIQDLPVAVGPDAGGALPLVPTTVAEVLAYAKRWLEEADEWIAEIEERITKAGGWSVT